MTDQQASDEGAETPLQKPGFLEGFVSVPTVRSTEAGLLARIASPTEREARLLRLRTCLAERLFCPLEAVRPESRLTADLGADSLDFVDLMFQMESLFGVSFEKDQFFLHFKETAPDGSLKPEAVRQLAAWLPELTALAEGNPIRPEQLFPMITVETLLQMAERGQ